MRAFFQEPIAGRSRGLRSVNPGRLQSNGGRRGKAFVYPLVHPVRARQWVNGNGPSECPTGRYRG